MKKFLKKFLDMEKYYLSQKNFKFFVVNNFYLLLWLIKSKILKNKILNKSLYYKLLGVLNYEKILKTPYGLFYSKTVEQDNFFNPYWEANTKQYFLNKNLKNEEDIFLDIGANIGLYSIILGKKGFNVYAFEPLPSIVSILKKNIKLNNLDSKIKIIPFALGNEEKEVIMEFLEEIPGQSHVIKNEEKNIKNKNIRVIQKKLDTIIKEYNIDPEKIKMIKIDVEGYELNVLKGSLQTLKEVKECDLIIESSIYNVENVKKLLLSLNFIYEGVLDNYGDIGNYLFVKRIN